MELYRHFMCKGSVCYVLFCETCGIDWSRMTQQDVNNFLSTKWIINYKKLLINWLNYSRDLCEDVVTHVKCVSVKVLMDLCCLSNIIMTYVVSSLLSTISTLSRNQPALAWLLSCRILSFFRTPRSTAVMLKTSSWVTREQRVKKCHRS